METNHPMRALLDEIKNYDLRAKLTPAEQIRAIRVDPRNTAIVAAEYGIDQSAVSDIKGRRTWDHIP